MHRKSNQYQRAADYYRASLHAARTLNNKPQIAANLVSLAELFITFSELPLTTRKKHLANTTAKEYPPATATLPMSTVVLLQKARLYLDEAMALPDESVGKYLFQRIYVALSYVYEQQRDYSSALEMYKKYKHLSDSNNNTTIQGEAAKVFMNYKFNEQQKIDSLQNVQEQQLAAAKLKRQKTYTYSGIGVALVLMLLAFFIAKERKKSDSLLLNILPTEVAKELKKKGESDARMFDHVTVLFTDFVGFTKVSEQLSAKELVTELDTCFKAFDGIMGKYGIEKIKTVGDAYLAVCGLPTPNEHHAEQVVSAAQEIRAFMVNRHAQLSDKTFEVRIGVHSGEVVAGIVGVKKFAYDIWGDTVNTAARMEQNSQPGKINISQTTYELVQDKFTCIYRGELEAKNKGKLKMYFVGG